MNHAAPEAGRKVGPGFITRLTFRLVDRIKVQKERNKSGDYIIAGKLMTVVIEREMSSEGLSAPGGGLSRAYTEAQQSAWQKITLDWLHHKNAPVLAMSRDWQDALLPCGLTPLPDVPLPGWVPKHYEEICPRVPQILKDRAVGRIGPYLVIRPVVDICLMIGGPRGGFGKIRCVANEADGTHVALLVQEENPENGKNSPAYFVGGRFLFGG